MPLAMYQINAFTSRQFAGNPAAVVALEDWLDDQLMQRIAAENNLSETAFIVAESDVKYGIRWFTPTVEVDLCGHATLAAAWVIGNELQPSENELELTFESKSGELSVKGSHDRWTLDFPAYELTAKQDLCSALTEVLGAAVTATYQSVDIVAVLEDAAAVEKCKPDLERIGELKSRGVVITALGDDASEWDFVSRFFAPQSGINEDPVTGSAHCELMPYWSGVLGRNELKAKQLSRRGGELICQLSGERVLLIGRAVKYFRGEIWTH